jgi:hypothetical protein
LFLVCCAPPELEFVVFVCSSYVALLWSWNWGNWVLYIYGAPPELFFGRSSGALGAAGPGFAV